MNARLSIRYLGSLAGTNSNTYAAQITSKCKLHFSVATTKRKEDASAEQVQSRPGVYSGLGTPNGTNTCLRYWAAIRRRNAMGVE